ncbi:MAG: hypothetical protein R3C15_19850 [Thermoleophilia bacterium]
MRVEGILWVGRRTARLDAMAGFLERSLGLERVAADEGRALFQAVNGDLVELYGPAEGGEELADGPVVEFAVEDLEQARRELAAAGVEVVADGYTWLHVRAPDGTVVGLKSGRFSDEAG